MRAHSSLQSRRWPSAVCRKTATISLTKLSELRICASLHGNFLVAKAGGNHFDDFRFASRENLDDFLRFFALRESVERAADERRLESALAALHAANGVDQIDRRRLLEH